MSVLEQIAYYQNRRDEVPNQELAKALVAGQDVEGIHEIAQHLWDKNKNVRSDCLKVLYEIGYLEPALIAPYAEDFLKLLQEKNNRLVWGAMIGLSTIANISAKIIWPWTDDIIEKIEHGTVITKVSGVKVLAKVAAADPAYSEQLFPYLLEILNTSIPRDVPTHGESIFPAVNTDNRAAFLAAMEARRPEMSKSQDTAFETSPEETGDRITASCVDKLFCLNIEKDFQIRKSFSRF